MKDKDHPEFISDFSNWLEAIARELRNGDLDKAIEQTTHWLRAARNVKRGAA